MHLVKKINNCRRSCIYLNKPKLNRGYYTCYTRKHKTLYVDMQDGTYGKGHLTSDKIIKVNGEKVENAYCGRFKADGDPAYIVTKFVKQETKEVVISESSVKDNEIVECDELLNSALLEIEAKANSKAVVNVRETKEQFIKRLKD